MKCVHCESNMIIDDSGSPYHIDSMGRFDSILDDLHRAEVNQDHHALEPSPEIPDFYEIIGFDSKGKKIQRMSVSSEKLGMYVRDHFDELAKIQA